MQPLQNVIFIATTMSKTILQNKTSTVFLKYKDKNKFLFILPVSNINIFN